jgi:hypothetical protein
MKTMNNAGIMIGGTIQLMAFMAYLLMWRIKYIGHQDTTRTLRKVNTWPKKR